MKGALGAGAGARVEWVSSPAHGPLTSSSFPAYMKLISSGAPSSYQGLPCPALPCPGKPCPAALVEERVWPEGTRNTPLAEMGSPVLVFLPPNSPTCHQTLPFEGASLSNTRKDPNPLLPSPWPHTLSPSPAWAPSVPAALWVQGLPG